MSRTFEEMASRELDSLYQGALFLSGGDARFAERLLVDTMVSAYRAHTADADDAAMDRWLESRLVAQFLSGSDLAPRRLPPSGERAALKAFAGLASDTLFAAAAVLPFWGRAAVWLVLLRRWSYADACEALGIERSVLDDLLRYRDVLMAEVLKASHRAGGTGGARM